MKTRKLLCILLTLMLMLSVAPLAALATDGDITVNLVEGEAIYFYLVEENTNLVLYVKSGDNTGVACTGTVNLVGNNVTIPKIHAGRDVGINNVTISGSNITISEGITASEGWGADYWAQGNTGPSVSNLTIAADYVTINGGINGGKGGDALGSPGVGGAVSNLTLSGSNITINGGINGGKGGNALSSPAVGGAVSNLTLSGSNITINGGINGGSGTQSGADGAVSGMQVPVSSGHAVLTYGADSAAATAPTTLTADTDITETIAGQNYIRLIRHANTPTGIAATGCTNTEQNDGKLTGVNSTMEYKLISDTAWTAITADTVTGLKNGTYEVRVAATDTVLASDTVTVTVDAFVPTPSTAPTPTAPAEPDDTGDRHDILLPFLLLFLSSMSLMAVAVAGKKRG